MNKYIWRLGNLFIDTEGSYCESGSVQVVQNIDANGANEWNDMGASGYCPYDKMKPVELSEEWVDRIGFDLCEIQGHNDLYSFGKFFIKKYGNEWILYGGDILNFYIFAKVRFAHEVQNYLLLSGEELIIR